MIILKILDVKKFMAGFLTGTMLDHCLIASGSVTTFCTFRIDGTYHGEFFRSTSASPSAPSGATVTDLKSIQKNQMPKNTASDSPDLKSKEPALAPWKAVRPFCFSIVRGRHTPLSFKFVFYLSSDRVAGFCRSGRISFDPNNMPGLCLNLKFDQTGLFLTTGISRAAFSPDRSLDEAWDRYVPKWLDGLGISTEKI